MHDKLTLVIGNRNYSSWSLRAALAARHSRLPIEEILIPLDRPDTRAELAKLSPSGLVPVLKIGNGETATIVWDSLAIIEALNDLAPAAGLWPTDIRARAVARSVSAEMHAGFFRLRRDMPMDLRADHAGKRHTEGALADAGRIQALWRDCRQRFGAGGPYLFGTWSAADMMYAPVVGRFRSYAAPLDADAAAYVEAVWAQSDMAAWCAAATAEPYAIDVLAEGAA